MYIVRPRAFASDREKAFAGEETVGPLDDDLVADAFAAKRAEGGVASLRASERTSWAVDVSPGTHDMGVRIGVGHVWKLLALDGVQGGGDDLFVESETELVASLAHREKDGSGAERGGDPGGFLRGKLIEEIKISPAAVHIRVAVHKLYLLLGEFLVTSSSRRIGFPLIKPDQGAQTVGMAPDIVDRLPKGLDCLCFLLVMRVSALVSPFLLNRDMII